MSTTITSTSNSAAPNRNSNLNVFNKNPLTDAVIWGAVGAAGGAGGDYIIQSRVLTNTDKLNSKIKALEKDIVEISKQENDKHIAKNIKNLQHELDCLKNNRINIKGIRNCALLLGLITFVPQLIINYAMLGGKKVYDKVKQEKAKI